MGGSGSNEGRQRKERDRGKERRKHVPDESVALVFENSNFLDRAKGREGLLHELLREAISQASAVDGAIGRATLIVNLVERQWLRVRCNHRAEKHLPLELTFAVLVPLLFILCLFFRKITATVIVRRCN